MGQLHGSSWGLKIIHLCDTSGYIFKIFHWLYFESLEYWWNICIDFQDLGLASPEQLEKIIDYRDIEEKKTLV